MSPAEWALRPVRIEDIDAMQALVHACFEEYRDWAPEGWSPPAPRRDPRERMSARLATPVAGGRVAEIDGSHAGHILWIPAADSEHMDTADPTVAYLWQLFVAPRHRGGGLASELVRAGAEAVAPDYEEMRLLTPRDNARARRFYEREGWELLGDWGVDPDLQLPIVEYGRRLRERSGQNEAR